MQQDDQQPGKSVGPTPDVRGDQFVLIRIDGMHCHKCEAAISKSLQRNPGVHEVEVDFASGQASVLFDITQVGVAQLMESVRTAGYKPTGFSQSHADSTTP